METSSSLSKICPRAVAFALFWCAFLNYALPTSASAQTPDEPFKILAARNAVILEPTRERPARAGVVLKAEYNLRVAGEGYIALLHHKGKAFELRGEGLYAVKELSAKYDKESAPKSSTHKLAAFVLQSVSAESEAASHRQQMRAVGAVARMSSGGSNAIALSPRAGAIADTVVVFRWYAPNPQEQSESGGALPLPLARTESRRATADSVSGGSAKKSAPPRFRLEIHAPNGATLYALETQDSMHMVNLRLAGVKRGDAFCWTVGKMPASEKEQQPRLAEYRARLLSETETVEIREVLSALREEFSSEPHSPLAHFLAGGILEQNLCYAEALNEYAKAVFNAPNVNDYVEALNALGVKLGLTEEETARLRFQR